jgi:chromosome partitioning protein
VAVKIAVINQKGGVGKTTTVINIAAYMGRDNHQVLVVDLDPQGNATSGFGVDKQSLSAGTYDILLDPDRLPEATLDLPFDGVSLVGTDQNLAGAEVELVSMPQREYRLKQALEPVTHDYVLIDCPPSLGLLTINALACAHFVLIPVQAEYYALEGISQLLATIKKVKETLNPDLAILGVVVTMYDSRTSLSEQVAVELRKHFADLVFKTTVPRNVRLAEAPSFGKPVADHDRWSKGARAYKQLAKEILHRAK